VTEVIAPFEAYLPRPDLAAQIVAPRYDGSSPEHGGGDGSGPLSFLNLIRAEVDFPARDDAHRRSLLAEAAARLRELVDGPQFVHHPGPMYLVCRLALGGHSQLGVIGDVPVDAYDRGDVKVHESTRRGQEDRLVEYLEAVSANFLPLFLIHRVEPALEALLSVAVRRSPSVHSVSGDGLEQTVWVVDDPAEVERYRQVLSRISTLYIADGHHRAAAASRYAAIRRRSPDHRPGAPYESFLAVLFSSEQLEVHDYNRCVVPPRPAPEVLAEIGELVHVATEDGPRRPRRQGELAMYLDGRWHRLLVPSQYRDGDPPDSLDVAILHDRIIGPVFGVDDPRVDERIDFVPGTLGLEEIAITCEERGRVGFALHPVSVDELLEVADRGGEMPPKSTWFAPKLSSGLVIRFL
jgi:uncharacterized protein (DUF1015 family)